MHKYMTYTVFSSVFTLCLISFTAILTEVIMWQWSHIHRNNKTDVKRRQTLGHFKSLNPNISTTSPNNHLYISKSYILSAHVAIQLWCSYHLPCQGSRNFQKSDISHVVIYWSTLFDCLSNTTHRYRKSIEKYSIDNIIMYTSTAVVNMFCFSVWNLLNRYQLDCTLGGNCDNWFQ